MFLEVVVTQSSSPPSLCLPIAPNQVQPGLDPHHTGHWTPTSAVAPGEELHHRTAVSSTTDSAGGLDLWGPQSSQWFPLHILRNPKERFVIATYHSFPMGFISFTMFLSQSNLLGIVLKFF